MKCKFLAAATAATVLAVSGTALAGIDVSFKVDDKPCVLAQSKPQTPQFQKGQRPPLPPEVSRDRRMPPPPEAHSRDRRPPEFDGKKPPVSRDNRMPPPPEAHSRDKRPQMPRKSK